MKIYEIYFLKYFLVFIFLITKTSIFAQECITAPPSNHQTAYDIIDSEKKSPSTFEYNEKTISSYLMFELQFHLVKSNLNDEPYNDAKKNIEDRINKNITFLNRYFTCSNIKFKSSNKLNIIISEYAKLPTNIPTTTPSPEESKLCQGNFKKKAINIFLFEEFINNSIPIGTDIISPLGYTYFPDQEIDWIILLSDALFEPATIAHELGHFFGLYHTHETYSGKELVDGSNNKTAGDFIIDTPADNKYFAANACYDNTYCWFEIGCKEIKDDNGDSYIPHIDNIMSYYMNCRNRFTAMQCNKIYETALIRKEHLIINKKYDENSNLHSQNNVVTEYTNLMAAAERSKKKYIVVLFYNDSIRWCRRMLSEMRSDVFTQKPIANNFAFTLYDIDLIRLREEEVKSNFFSVTNATNFAIKEEFLGSQNTVVPSPFKADDDSIFLNNLPPDLRLLHNLSTTKRINYEYHLLLRELRPKMVSYPAIVIIKILDDDEKEQTPCVVQYIEGYLKPREVNTLLHKYVNYNQ